MGWLNALMPIALPQPAYTSAEDQAEVAQHFVDRRQDNYRKTDRLFAALMLCQWAGAIVAASLISPHTYRGAHSSVHPHVLEAIFLGGLITAPPVALGFWRAGRPLTRYTVSVCQALTSVLLIDVTGGRIETHFHIFGSLAFLAFYLDWTVLVPFTIVTAIDHYLGAIYVPLEMYGVGAVGPWRWVEHVGWVAFEDVFLVVCCIRGRMDMRTSAVSEAASEALNRQLAQVKDGALDSIVTIESTGVIQSFNPAAESMYGHRREQVIGRRWAEVVVPPELLAEAQRRVAQAQTSGTHPWLGRRVETVHMRSDGSRFPVEISVAMLGRHPAAWVTYTRDITEHKRAEEQARHAEKLALVASGTDNAVIITDVAGHIEWVNEAFTRIAGYALSEVIGKIPGHFLQGPRTSAGTVAHMRQRLRAGTGFSVELVNYTKAGEPYWLSIDVRPILGVDGAVQHFIAIERDITSRKESDAQLLRAKEQAEASSIAKSQFLATMSHEIRTPLNGVIGMADMLIRKGGLTAQQLRCVSVIRCSGDSLLSLLNDVLDFSKIEAGKLELNNLDFNLHAAVEEVMEMLSPKAAAKGLAFACRIAPQVPVEVNGDPDRLRQILINLVNNAIKFTERGEVIVRVSAQSVEADPVQATAAPHAAAPHASVPHASVPHASVPHASAPPTRAPAARTLVRFDVHDTGLGIPADRLDRLFKSFSQVDASTTRKYGGTGLGLAIVKQLAQLMGGDASVQSVAGAGCTFTATASFAAAPERAAAASASPSPLLHNQPVLVVDDQVVYCQILAEQLVALGARPHIANNAEAGLTMLRRAALAREPFRVALIDLIMPGVNGAVLAQQVKADPLLSATALILMTGIDDAYDADRLKIAGLDAGLIKPVRQSALFEALVSTLGRSGASDVSAPASMQQMIPPSGVRLHAHVLLAEDNLVNQEVARELLLDAGCVVDVVGTGAAAVEAAKSRRYDAVLMDCMMPEMDGFEATASIRANERLLAGGAAAAGVATAAEAAARRVPIIALTANAVGGDYDRCIAAGMDDYVAKPIDSTALLAALARHLPMAAAHSAPPPIAPAAPAGDAPINLAALLARCSGKSSLADRLLSTFERTIDAQVEQLREAVRQMDWKSLQRVAHGIKGATANLSAEPIRAAAAILEARGSAAATAGADAANPPPEFDAPAALAALERQVRQCLDYLPSAHATLQKQDAVAAVSTAMASTHT
jgi:two-component system sensor histidine kinase/response regulator